jgi:hypothetical protein
MRNLMKKRKRMIGAMAASVALAITSLATAGSSAGAVEAAPYPHCPGGKVCMWSEPHFQGARYDWSPDEGNVFLGDHGLADKVASFVATVDGCFQDSPPPGPGQWRRFAPNDWSANYAFGRQVDRIKPGC